MPASTVAPDCQPRREWVKNRRLLIYIGLGVLVLASFWPRHFSIQDEGGLRLAFSVTPSPPKVGEAIARLSVSDDRTGTIPTSPHITIYYYPFVFRNKDAQASPDEVVRLVEANHSGNGYSGKLKFSKPGPWKITVKVTQPSKSDVFATFTVDVQS